MGAAGGMGPEGTGEEGAGGELGVETGEEEGLAGVGGSGFRGERETRPGGLGWLAQGTRGRVGVQSGGRV